MIQNTQIPWCEIQKSTCDLKNKSPHTRDTKYEILKSQHWRRFILNKHSRILFHIISISGILLHIYFLQNA